ncbi:hypothetical protein D3C81_1674430 [compost metagenome]
MNIIADNFHRHRRRIEVLAFQLTDTTAIYGIGPLGVELCNVKKSCALAHFLVRRKSHANIAVGDIALLQPHHGGQNFGNACLVIGTEQRFAVGSDQRLPQHLVQDREHHRR